MKNPGLTKSLYAEAAVSPYRIVKFGSTDNYVVQGAASTDALMGVANNLGGAITKRVDVIFAGVTEVEYGGTITRGQPITSDSDGKAVAAAPATGVNARIAGFAMQSGVSGDIGSILLNPGLIQGQ